MTARNARYDRNSQASQALNIPVVSIGNITVGGTGKTPIVMETVRCLRDLGVAPVILTRGYGATDPNQADEVLEYRDAEQRVPVVANADRLAGARTAVRQHGATGLVLDDGFQHRRLRRDLDVVVIDALNPWGGGWVLPAGRLREPLRGLGRAGLVVISRANQVQREVVAAIDARLAEIAGETPVIEADVLPQAAVDLDERAFCPGAVCLPLDLARVWDRQSGHVCPHARAAGRPFLHTDPVPRSPTVWKATG